MSVTGRSVERSSEALLIFIVTLSSPPQKLGTVCVKFLAFDLLGKICKGCSSASNTAAFQMAIYYQQGQSSKWVRVTIDWCSSHFIYLLTDMKTWDDAPPGSKRRHNATTPHPGRSTDMRGLVLPLAPMTQLIFASPSKISARQIQCAP